MHLEPTSNIGPFLHAPISASIAAYRGQLKLKSIEIPFAIWLLVIGTGIGIQPLG
jgi:hypothetical protein